MIAHTLVNSDTAMSNTPPKSIFLKVLNLILSGLSRSGFKLTIYKTYPVSLLHTFPTYPTKFQARALDL